MIGIWEPAAATVSIVAVVNELLNDLDTAVCELPPTKETPDGGFFG